MPALCLRYNERGVIVEEEYLSQSEAVKPYLYAIDQIGGKLGISLGGIAAGGRGFWRLKRYLERIWLNADNLDDLFKFIKEAAFYRLEDGSTLADEFVIIPDKDIKVSISDDGAKIEGMKVRRGQHIDVGTIVLEREE